MPYHFLTLSIAEAKPGSAEFEINCFHVKTSFKAPIYSFVRTKEQIFDNEGQPLWDIGKLTATTEEPQPKAKENSVYIPKGKIRLCKEREIPIETLKKMLEYNKTEYTEFRKNKTCPFAIVSARRVIQIEGETIEPRKLNMYLDFDDDHRKIRLLNKDYRWVHYWQQIPDNLILEKQNHYLEILNQPGKTLYLILRRYHFPKGNEVLWISGMHWL